MRNYDAELENGLTFAREQLVRRLNDSGSDPLTTADVALAALALVAARDARSRESLAFLKFPQFVERRDVARRRGSFDESAPSVVNFATATAAASGVSASSPRVLAETRRPRLKLYRED